MPLQGDIVPLGAATAGEIEAARTDGEGYFETSCFSIPFFGIQSCKSHTTAVPKLVKEGQTIELVSQGESYGEFYINSIFQESNGNCFLYNSNRDPEGIVMLGKCEPVTASAVPPTEFEVKKLRRAMADLGAFEGIVVLCARSPHADDETAQRWWGKSGDLLNIAIEYAKHVYPNNEDARGIALLTFLGASHGQRENPERIWDHPDG